MAQYIKQGSLFGRIGTGVGKGLAEQLPEEINRGRLASGLKNFEQDHQNLNPIQQLARISSIPGITPQMIQSFSELARINNQGNAFRNAAGGAAGNRGAQNAVRSSPDLTEVKEANLLDQAAAAGMPMQQTLNPQANPMPPAGEVQNNQRTPNVGRTEDVPQVAPGNPLNAQNLPKLPWSPQERNAAIADYINQGFLPDQAKQLAADDEARDLGQPEVHKQRQADIKQAKGEVRDVLKRHLETKLQKTGENVYKDVEGPMILAAERGMTRDLIMNPKADIDNVANDWSERLYRTAVAKDKLRTLGQTTGFENFLKGNESVQKLKEYQDIFKRSGNLEEFRNILEGPDFGMSPQAASFVAYPPSKKIANYISNFKASGLPTQDPNRAKKAAIEIENLEIGPDDSILAIARALSNRDPFFDQQAFFDQISEDKDKIGLNERQRLELGQGQRSILPNWGDLLFLPIFRR